MKSALTKAPSDISAKKQLRKFPQLRPAPDATAKHAACRGRWISPKRRGMRMLIVAWLIGESFAIGMNQRALISAELAGEGGKVGTDLMLA
jgi:hypothetical protein